jgi:DNA-binding PadR family transcriptional regulator
MSTAHVLLGLLSGGPQHGYDLKRSYDERLPLARPIAFGQVYATLGRLERDGLVTRDAEVRAGGPDRTPFQLTHDGERALDEWLAAIEPPAPHVGGTILAKVLVALFVAGDGPAYRYLTAQRGAHTRRLRELTAVKTDPHSRPDEIIAADYAITHLDADLRWLDNTLRRVRKDQT